MGEGGFLGEALFAESLVVVERASSDDAVAEDNQGVDDFKRCDIYPRGPVAAEMREPLGLLGRRR